MQTVTGSKTLLTAGKKRLLVDWGLFQGQRELKERNWADLPVDPRATDAVVLTHAHFDYSVYLPVRRRGRARLAGGGLAARPAPRVLVSRVLFGVA